MTTAPALYRPSKASALSVGQQKQDERLRFVLVYVSIVGVGALVGLFGTQRAYQPWFVLCYGVWMALLLGWVVVPRAALALTLSFAVAGDLFAVAWYPFTKNLSSVESLMYLHDAVSVSPLEITIAWALALTMVRRVAAGEWPVPATQLRWPMLGLSVLIVFGLVTGYARGGFNQRIALIELRPLVLFVIAHVVVAGTCMTRRDFRWVFGAVVAGLTAQALLAHRYIRRLPAELRVDNDLLVEHGTAISFNLVFAMLLAALVYRGVGAWWRVGLAFCAVPMVLVYAASQRRAAIVGLVLVLAVLALFLYWRQPGTFRKVGPVVGVLLLGYLAAFWNVRAGAGFPAQAVRVALFPDQAGAADASSNLYRDIENYDLLFTIRSNPLTGIGFGQRFYRPIPLPDISRFEFYEYIPHNAFLWLWVKMGVLAIPAFLYLIARSLMTGAARARWAPAGIDAVIAAAAVSFVVVFAVYQFVDMAWEPRNVMLLALCTAVCAGARTDDSDRLDAEVMVKQMLEEEGRGYLRR